MSKNEDLFIECLAERLDKYSLHYFNCNDPRLIVGAVSKYISFFEGTRELVFELELVTDTIAEMPISLEEQKELFISIIKRGLDNLQKTSFDIYSKNFHLPYSDVLKYLNEKKIFNFENNETIAFEISEMTLTEIKNSKYATIVSEYINYRNYRKIFEMHIYGLLYMLNELENGETMLDKSSFDHFVELTGINKKFYRRITKKPKEKETEEIKINIKFEQNSDCLTEKDYKTIRKEIDSIYDIRLCSFKRIVTYEEIYDIAKKIDIIYGREHIKGYFDNLLRDEMFSEKDRLKYFIDKILYYKDFLDEEKLNDLAFFSEMIDSEEYTEWYIEIKNSISKMLYNIPSNCLFEESIVKEAKKYEK